MQSRTTRTQKKIVPRVPNTAELSFHDDTLKRYRFAIQTRKLNFPERSRHSTRITNARLSKTLLVFKEFPIPLPPAFPAPPSILFGSTCM